MFTVCIEWDAELLGTDIKELQDCFGCIYVLFVPVISLLKQTLTIAYISITTGSAL